MRLILNTYNTIAEKADIADEACKESTNGFPKKIED